MTDKFPNFSFTIIQEWEKYFLYNLVNEEENEFLAAIYLDVVNVTDEWSRKVTVEKSRQQLRRKQT